MNASIPLIEKSLFQERSFDLGRQADAHPGFRGQFLELPGPLGVAEQNPGDAARLHRKRVNHRLLCRSNGPSAFDFHEKPGGREPTVASLVQVTDPL
jgi:hypothetical protein